MVDIQAMLPDLKGLVKFLGEDLHGEATSKPDVDAFLRGGYADVKEAERSSQSFEEWREDYLEQVAVAWVLACIFVRFLEDNGLIDEAWIAGDTEDRQKLALGAYEIFFRTAGPTALDGPGVPQARLRGGREDPRRHGGLRQDEDAALGGRHQRRRRPAPAAVLP